MGNLIVDLMVENGNLDKEVKRLQLVLIGLEEQNKEVAKENKELKSSVDYLNQVRNELRLEIDYLKSLINDKVYAVLNDEMLELKNKNEKQAKLLGTLKGKLDTHRRNSKKLQRELEEEEIESKNLREQNEQLIRSYNRLKNELDRANRKLVELEKENGNIRKNTEKICLTETDIKNNLYKEINNLKEELNKLKSKEYLNEKWGRYENIISDLKRTLNEKETIERDYNRDIEQLEKKLKDDRWDCERLYAERHMLMNIKDEKIKEINMLKAKLNITEKDIEKLRDKYKKLEEINKKLNKSLIHFMNKTKENEELIINMKELLSRYLRCATEPSFYLSLEKEIQFNEHLLSTVLFLKQAHLISDKEYYNYTEDITKYLNKLKEGIDNEKR